MLFWIAISMTIGANVIYHLCSKMTAPVNPLVALTVTYAVSLTTCLILYPFFSKQLSFMAELRQLNWASVILGLSIVLLEAGFILAYRSGWSLNHAVLFSNVAVTLILIPISVLVFREHLSIVKATGIGFALIGLILMTRP